MAIKADVLVRLSDLRNAFSMNQDLSNIKPEGWLAISAKIAEQVISHNYDELSHPSLIEAISLKQNLLNNTQMAVVNLTNINQDKIALWDSTSALVETKANDNAVVKLVGEQTINGVKTFIFGLKTSAIAETPDSVVNVEYVSNRFNSLSANLNNANVQTNSELNALDSRINTINSEIDGRFASMENEISNILNLSDYKGVYATYTELITEWASDNPNLSKGAYAYVRDNSDDPDLSVHTEPGIVSRYDVEYDYTQEPIVLIWKHTINLAQLGLADSIYFNDGENLENWKGMVETDLESKVDKSDYATGMVTTITSTIISGIVQEKTLTGFQLNANVKLPDGTSRVDSLKFFFDGGTVIADGDNVVLKLDSDLIMGIIQETLMTGINALIEPKLINQTITPLNSDPTHAIKITNIKSVNGTETEVNHKIIKLNGGTFDFDPMIPDVIEMNVDGGASGEYVKLQSDTTQIINSDLSLAEGNKLFGTNSAGEEHEIIGLNEYAGGQQTEVGSEHVALCLNHAEVENWSDKHIAVNYEDLEGVSQTEKVAYVSDVETATTTLESYADNVGVTATADAKTYTDSAVQFGVYDANGYTDTTVAAAITTVEEYSDTSVAEALNDAANYTDEQISPVSGLLDTTVSRVTMLEEQATGDVWYVSTLDEQDNWDTTKGYLVTPDAGESYDKWVWVNDNGDTEWKMIGNTGSMNFGDYYTKSETDGLLTPINSAVTALQTGKQDVITGTQLDALNSGINTTKVATYDGYASNIATKANSNALIPTLQLVSTTWEGIWSEIKAIPTSAPGYMASRFNNGSIVQTYTGWAAGGDVIIYAPNSSTLKFYSLTYNENFSIARNGETGAVTATIIQGSAKKTNVLGSLLSGATTLATVAALVPRIGDTIMLSYANWELGPTTQADGIMLIARFDSTHLEFMCMIDTSSITYTNYCSTTDDAATFISKWVPAGLTWSAWADLKNGGSISVAHYRTTANGKFVQVQFDGITTANIAAYAGKYLYNNGTDTGTTQISLPAAVRPISNLGQPIVSGWGSCPFAIEIYTNGYVGLVNKSGITGLVSNVGATIMYAK